jgi:hypothetical protein
VRLAELYHAAQVNGKAFLVEGIFGHDAEKDIPD